MFPTIVATFFQIRAYEDIFVSLKTFLFRKTSDVFFVCLILLSKIVPYKNYRLVVELNYVP